MMKNPDLEGKRIFVLGLGLSGISAIRLCLARGAVVTGLDRKRECDLDRAIFDLRKSGARILAETEVLDEAADLLICSPGVPLSHPMLALCARKEIRVYSEIELASWYCPGPIVAVTGTDGKSSVVSMIYQILSDQGRTAMAVGNIGYPFSQQILDCLPDPATVSVVEVSSYQLELIGEFHPHVAAILNIAPDHLSRHGSLEEYAQAKYRITRNQRENDYLVRPMVLPGSFQSNAQTLFWALQSHELPGVQYEPSTGKLTIRFSSREPVVLSAPGLNQLVPHQRENALAALTVCLPLKVDPRKAVQSLIAFPGLPHRLEYLGKWSGVSYYNDSKATNVHSCQAALEAVEGPILLLAGGLAKKEDYATLGPLLKKKVKVALLFGEARESLQKAWESSVPVVSYPTLEQATREAIERAEPGDTGLLSPACASQDRFLSFEQRGNFFKSLVNDWVIEKKS
jgi:UDP-N-acetylmuramoylalanine--D-glutamate ligase